MIFQEDVDGAFENKGIIDGNAPNFRLFISNKVKTNLFDHRAGGASEGGLAIYHQVPTRGATAGLRAVHDIIGNQEHRLEL